MFECQCVCDAHLREFIPTIRERQNNGENGKRAIPRESELTSKKRETDGRRFEYVEYSTLYE